MSYPVTILEREFIANNTIALKLSRPEGFEFIAGQNIDVTVEDPRYADPNDNSRIFSIASAPSENHILIAARLRDNPYKNALNELPIGSELYIEGPFGTFRLHDDITIPAVFIAGGIGITPCLSILRQAVYEKSRRSFCLFYSNRTVEDSTYLDELRSMYGLLPNYSFIPTLTRSENSTLERGYEKGRVTSDMLKKHIPDLNFPLYYVVGKSQMVWGLIQQLDGSIDRSRYLVEDFVGF